MTNQPNRSAFLPVFLISIGPAYRTVELRYPDVDGDKEGFDGACCYSQPPTYPCLVISTVSNWRRMPNRVLKSSQDWTAFVREYHARQTWLYDVGPADPMQDSAAALDVRIEKNGAAAAQNKARGAAARTVAD